MNAAADETLCHLDIMIIVSIFPIQPNTDITEQEISNPNTNWAITGYSCSHSVVGGCVVLVSCWRLAV